MVIFLVLDASGLNSAETQDNFARDYAARGSYRKALECYKRALEIRRERIGEFSSETVTSYVNLAKMYSALLEYDNALEALLDALKINRKFNSSEHLSMGVLYSSIAQVYDAKNEFETSLEYYTQALAINEKTFGTHPNTVTLLSKTANSCFAHKDYEKALDYYKRAVRTNEDLHGMAHVSNAVLYEKLGDTYFETNDAPNAEKFYNSAISTYKSVRAENGEDCKRVLEKFQRIL
ncbi:hypothetical protein FACS1894188_11240 [Clostridia bacterium]|nr:hypothetical protein FACS1894188_11240 [Clostridia bacterium]